MRTWQLHIRTHAHTRDAIPRLTLSESSLSCHVILPLTLQPHIARYNDEEWKNLIKKEPGWSREV